MMTTKRNTKKPNGDVDKKPESIELVRREAQRTGKPRAEVCPADHTYISGRSCGYCGTYFHGDDMG